MQTSIIITNKVVYTHAFAAKSPAYCFLVVVVSQRKRAGRLSRLPLATRAGNKFQ